MFSVVDARSNHRNLAPLILLPILSPGRISNAKAISSVVMGSHPLPSKSWFCAQTLEGHDGAALSRSVQVAAF